MTWREIGAVVLVLSSVACSGPLPFMSGGALEGEVQPTPSQWSFEDDFGVIQFETNPADPYSVNIAYTLVDGRLYVHAGDTQTQWVKNMQVDPRVRFRRNGALYDLRAERVTDPVEISAFARAWVSHSMFHRDPEELEQVWLYRLSAR